MTSIGVLPTVPGTLPSEYISLFGILSLENVSIPTTDEQCHYCLECVRDAGFPIMSTPCCKHYAHCECFRRWVFKPPPSTCAYCRAVYIAEDYCFLCLQKITVEPLHATTSCCKTTVHLSCALLLSLEVEGLPSVALQCGHPTKCGCMWLKP